MANTPVSDPSILADDVISSPTFWSEPSSHRMQNRGQDPAEPLVFVSGTDICVQDVKDAIFLFLRNFRDQFSSPYERKYLNLIHLLLEREMKNLNVDAHDVYEYDKDLYNNLVRYPDVVLDIFDIVLLIKVSQSKPSYTKYLQTRVFNLKTSTSIKNLNQSDIEKMVSLKGTIISCSSIIPEISEAVFRCKVCGHFSDLIFAIKGIFREPTMCMNGECKTKNSMTLDHNKCSFIDKQIVRIQETYDEIFEGCTPDTVSLVMREELVDAVKPGDGVEITGICRVSQTQTTVESSFKCYMDCLHIKSLHKMNTNTSGV